MFTCSGGSLLIFNFMITIFQANNIGLIFTVHFFVFFTREICVSDKGSRALDAQMIVKIFRFSFAVSQTKTGIRRRGW